MTAPDAVLELVERFARNREQYLNAAYNETQVRREFIDPLFGALGWDVDNKAGYAQQYKDVVHEDAIKIGLDARAPDYSFRIGGVRKFFVEAKKPAVNLRDDPAPAYQLRRYAWSAKLPLSVLTDFQELAVYDCRVKPAAGDKSSAARTLYIPFEDYEERWDEIVGVFGKEAILQGSFDRYAESTKAKKGTAEVDKAFLSEIETWRDALARNLALRNPDLSQRELNYAVQVTIDRIIFLRICEDRGIEPYGRLRGLCNGGGTYGRIKALFHEADARYNSGLFHFADERGRAGGADRLTLELTIDDKPLKDILKRLYYPESPYEFSVLPADILGQVYEQFLGKVIRLTSGHRAVVEDKPEVKKAGGVYYTPTYIVDYIVRNTVGRLLEGKTPKQAADLRILDPACGSGSFLIGAYQYLLDWHLKEYAEHPEKHRKELVQGRAGEWQLATAEKKRILLANIYGVDIDAQAVETTKLSLLLKVLEGETSDTIESQLSFLHERALPDLADNIKCGNSLIGPDFYDDQQLGLAGVGEEERYRINVFDWETEFSEILGKAVPEEKRGFDAVIGNPPYVKEYTNREPFVQLAHCSRSCYYEGKMDLWYAFACLSLDLLRSGGLHSFIATNNWTTSAGASILRSKILSEAQILSYLDFGGLMVFTTASIQTMVYVVQKATVPHHGIVALGNIGSRASSADVANALAELPVPTSGILTWGEVEISDRTPGQPFTFLDDKTSRVVSRLAAAEYRLAASDVSTGIDVHQDFVAERHLAKLGSSSRVGDGVFILSKAELDAMSLSPEERAVVRPFYTTSQLCRYAGNPANDLWIIYSDKDVCRRINSLPHLKAHFDQLAPIITSDNGPYGLHRPRDGRFFVGEKIISLRKTSRPCFTFTDFPCYVSQTYFVLKPSDINLKYLTGVLNSNACHFWLDRMGKKQGEALQVDKAPLLRIPIPHPTRNGASDPETPAKLASAVDEMIRVRNALRSSRTGQDKSALERMLAALQKRINRMVYDLYGLTDDEIAVVETP